MDIYEVFLENLEDIVKMKREGKSLREIGEPLNMKKATILYLQRKFMPIIKEMNFNSWTEFYENAKKEDIEEFRKLYKEMKDRIRKRLPVENSETSAESKEGKRLLRQLKEDLKAPAESPKEESKPEPELEPKPEPKQDPEQKSKMSILKDKWILWIGIGAVAVVVIILLIMNMKKDKTDKTPPAPPVKTQQPMDRYQLLGLPPEF